MSEFNSLLTAIGEDASIEQVEEKQPTEIEMKQIEPAEGQIGGFFDVQKFADELRQTSDAKGRAYAALTQSISGYDIAHNCISNVVKKITGHPVPSFAQSWLPILLRSTLGNAVHDFIQMYSTQFTELEPSIKIPSIRFSGRIDAISGHNVIHEIKSCNWKDYAKIIKTQKPRLEDFYQVMTYKYILENYVKEAQTHNVKTRTPPPKLDNYEIDKIQLIYVCHELTSSDAEDLSKSIKAVTALKKQLGAKNNPFHFITTINLDTTQFDPEPFTQYIKSKIERINYYLDSNKMPTKDDPFVDPKKCFFCLYYADCDLKK